MSIFLYIISAVIFAGLLKRFRKKDFEANEDLAILATYFFPISFIIWGLVILFEKISGEK